MAGYSNGSRGSGIGSQYSNDDEKWRIAALKRVHGENKSYPGDQPEQQNASSSHSQRVQPSVSPISDSLKPKKLSLKHKTNSPKRERGTLGSNQHENVDSKPDQPELQTTEQAEDNAFLKQQQYNSGKSSATEVRSSTYSKTSEQVPATSSPTIYIKENYLKNIDRRANPYTNEDRGQFYGDDTFRNTYYEALISNHLELPSREASESTKNFEDPNPKPGIQQYFYERDPRTELTPVPSDAGTLNKHEFDKFFLNNSYQQRDNSTSKEGSSLISD